jgi:capsular exopolysaccharide synthesis family protein
MKSSTTNVLNKLNNPAEEAYKVLRANLRFYGLNNALKTITVTSYNPNEGKTTTAINLSISLAKSGMKVLYVDADLRKPIFMKNIGSEDFQGLSNYLSGYADINELVHSTDMDGFFYVSCGAKPFDPATILNTERFDAFLEAVQQDYDTIIFDTPPIGSVIDGAIIAAKTDGVLIEIKPNTVKYKNTLMMIEQLEKYGAKILGLVLNGVNERDYKDYFNCYDYYGHKRKYAKKWFKNLTASKRE